MHASCALAGYAIAAYFSNATVGKVEKGVEALEKGLSDVRADITALRGELREEMAALRGALKEERYFVLGVVVLLGGMGSTALYQALKPR